MKTLKNQMVVATGDNNESASAVEVYSTIEEAKAYVDELTKGHVHDGVVNESNHNHAMVFNLASGYIFEKEQLDEDDFNEKHGFYPVDFFEVLDRDAERLGLEKGFYYPLESNECLYWVEYSIK